MLSLEKTKKMIILEKEQSRIEEERKIAVLLSKNSKFSISVMDSDVVGLSKKERNQSLLPRLHDRYPSSLKNFRYMVLKNQQMRNLNY